MTPHEMMKQRRPNNKNPSKYGHYLRWAHEFLYNSPFAMQNGARLLSDDAVGVGVYRLRFALCINIVDPHLILDNGFSRFKRCIHIHVRMHCNVSSSLRCCKQFSRCATVRMLIIMINEIQKCLTPFAKCTDAQHQTGQTKIQIPPLHSAQTSRLFVVVVLFFFFLKIRKNSHSTREVVDIR